MAKKNNNLLIIGVVLLAFIIFTSDGTLPFSIGGGAGGIPAPGQAPNNPGFTNILSLSDYDICRGDSLTVTVQTNIPNGECAAFVNPHNSGWQYLSSINLNANGQYSASQTINAPADNYLAGVVCGDDSGAFSFWNFCGMFPEICFPTPPADQPAAPQPDMTADPCDLNPNMIGCSPTTPTQPAVRQIYFGRCSGVSWGLPTEVLHSATGDRYTSFECTTNQECEDNPPGAYPGRPSALVCCNGECFDTP